MVFCPLIASSAIRAFISALKLRRCLDFILAPFPRQRFYTLLIGPNFGKHLRCTSARAATMPAARVLPLLFLANLTCTASFLTDLASGRLQEPKNQELAVTRSTIGGVNRPCQLPISGYCNPRSRAFRVTSLFYLAAAIGRACKRSLLIFSTTPALRSAALLDGKQGSLGREKLMDSKRTIPADSPWCLISSGNRRSCS